MKQSDQRARVPFRVMDATFIRFLSIVRLQEQQRGRPVQWSALPKSQHDGNMPRAILYTVTFTSVTAAVQRVKG